MMMRGTKIRLVAFVLISAVGVTYASANYLGLIDRILGRGFAVTAELSGTGGLYEGGLVTYRGVEVGKVASMKPRGEGVAIRLELEDDVKIPVDSPIYVHNGSAVGEQYLDFEPPSQEGPYLKEGATVRGNEDSLPVDEADLLINLDRFVGSVNRAALSTVIEELGHVFYETGRPLGDLLDGGSEFIEAATANKSQTISLLQRGRTVLRTQEASAGSIRDFADGLAQVTGALRAGDGDLRRIIDDGPATMTQFEGLLEDLEPTLPVMLGNLVTINQVTAVRIPALEQLLVTYPVVIASGFTGTTPDGYGHVHLDYTSEPPPCTKGYLPPSQWRRGDQTNDVKPYLKAHCASGPPYTMRGTNYAPRPGSARARVAPLDPQGGTFGVDGQRYRLDDGAGAVSDVYGEDAWKWILLGPTTGR
jgi:phospholipid/cholesterol/gamma-HCH transport system substrate-binding protein